MKIKFDNGHTVEFASQPSDADIEEAYAHTKTLPAKQDKRVGKFYGDIASGFKESLAGVGNTADRLVSGAAGGAAALFGDQEGSDQIFQELQSRVASRNEFAGPRDETRGLVPGLLGKLPLLPAQLLQFPAHFAEVGQQNIDTGESLSTATKAMGITGATDALAMAFPASIGANVLVKGATGAGANMLNTWAQNKALRANAEKEETKKAYSPSGKEYAEAGLLGLGFGALGPSTPIRNPFKKKTVSEPVKDFPAILADEPVVAPKGADIPALDATLEHPLAAETRVAAQNKQMRSADDWSSMDHAARAVDEEIAAFDKSQAATDAEALAAEQQRTHEFLRDAQQTVIDDTPHGDRPAQYGMTDTGGRVDENGIPIRADLSMEAQNLQNPLQRNLWGDELPGRTGDGGLPLTQALDRMPEGPARDTAMSQLRGQRGAIDLGNNASGESPASLEALGRLVEEGKLGRARAVIKQDGTVQPLIGVDAVDYRPRAGEVVVQKNIGNTPWTILDSNGVKNPQAQLNRGMARGQRGAIDFFKSKKPLPDAEDLVLKPPKLGMPLEEAARANAVADKAAAVGMSQYSRITDPAQVVAAGAQGAALPSFTGFRNATISGIEGMVRRYPQNKLLNFVRNTFQEARNTAEIWSKEYLTGKTGINTYLNELSTPQKNDVVGLMLAADRMQKRITDAHMAKAGFTPEQIKVVQRVHEAMDHLYAEKTKALGEQGFDAHQYREGYIPAIFGGAYKSLVGHYTKDGSWVTSGIAQADTLYGLKKAEEWYKQQDSSVEIIRAGTSKLGTGRTGLKQSSGVGRSNDAWANLISALAKVDPKFAEIKKMADQKGVDATANLYNYQVHELRKKGVTGSFGDRPWLDRDTNTKQFIQGLVEYLEDGYRYTAYQKPLVDTQSLLSNPDLRKAQPHASQYVDAYLDHIKGQSLNAFGAGLNKAVDMISSSVGLGHTKIANVAHEVSHYSALQMMGFGNIGFLGMQLTQMFSGGLPEAMSLAKQTGIEPNQVPKSLQNTLSFLQNKGLKHLGKEGHSLEPHMDAAFDWANQVGMFTFSESELAHQVLQSKLRKKTDKVLDASIRYGELATRPVVFMWYADMMHNAGYRGNDALLRAQTATDYAMVNYHPDERPMLYQSLGVVGSLMGALSTYKHNFGTQIVTRSTNALKEPAALGTFIALGAAMYGLGGFPGYEEMDGVVHKLSGKSIRQWVLQDPDKPNAAMDGWLSAVTEMDFQSRLSMSSMLPDSVGGMFPHISNFANITMKGFELAQHPDKGSFQDFALAALPKSVANAAESQLWEEGNVRNRTTGKNKYDTPRTPEKEMVRAITGIRPMREGLQDKNTYASRVTEAKRQDKLKAAQTRFDRAWLLQDGPGMDRAAGDYQENSGDLSTLFDSGRLGTMTEEANKSERARRAGTPTNTNTLKTYETFMGNK